MPLASTALYYYCNPEPYKALFSHREDVTLANPFFPVVRGWDEVSVTLERTASRLRDGEFLGSEIVAKCVTPSWPTWCNSRTRGPRSAAARSLLRSTYGTR